MTVQLPFISRAVILERWTSVVLRGVGLNAHVNLLAFVCFTIADLELMCRKSISHLVFVLLVSCTVQNMIGRRYKWQYCSHYVSLQPCITACGLAAVALCSVDRYIWRNLCGMHLSGSSLPELLLAELLSCCDRTVQLFRLLTASSGNVVMVVSTALAKLFHLRGLEWWAIA